MECRSEQSSSDETQRLEMVQLCKLRSLEGERSNEDHYSDM